MSEASIKVATWNLEWATPTSARGKIIDRLLLENDADILCLTEAHRANFPSGYHVIEAGADYGYDAPPNRRKVLLGAKQPWLNVDPHGSNQLPPGRFVAGELETEFGKLRIIGCCVPWRDAHVRTGRKNSSVWSEHRSYLNGLKPILAQSNDGPTIFLGDLNQTLPRTRQPEDVFTQLEDVISNFQTITQGFVWEGRQAIDHIAVSKALKASDVAAIPSHIDDQKLSDHFGLYARITFSESIEGDQNAQEAMPHPSQLKLSPRASY